MTIVVAAAGLLVGLLGAVLAVVAMSRARRMVATTAKRIRSELIASGPLDPRAVRDVAVVRYDALEEMAGQLSFSVAMLNSHGDGVVFTSINGRTETRTYAKVVADGQGVHQLSPEEQQAVRSAQLGHGPPTLLTQAPRVVGGHGPVRPATAADAERARTSAQWPPGPGEPDGRRPAGTRALDYWDGRGPAARAAGEADGKRPAAPGAADSDGRSAAAQQATEPPPRRDAADGHHAASAGDGARLPASDGSATPGPAGEHGTPAETTSRDDGKTPAERTGDPGGPAGGPDTEAANGQVQRGA